MQRRYFLAGSLAALAIPSIRRAEADDALLIRYNSNENIDADQIGPKALKLAIKKTGKSYRLVPSQLPYASQAGAESALRSGSLDMGMFGASRALTEVADPVLFPVDRGLLGYRTFLIHRDKQAAFSSVTSLPELRRFAALQGVGWGDIPILENAQIRVRTGLYPNLFRMTVLGRGDFFPRAANESVAEAAKYGSELPDLAVEQTLCLHYKFALMFFVAKTRPQLRDDLMRALEAAFADGSYEELFKSDQSVQLALTQGNLKGRRKIEIENPFLFEAFNRIDDKYWFRA